VQFVQKGHENPDRAVERVECVPPWRAVRVGSLADYYECTTLRGRVIWWCVLFLTFNFNYAALAVLFRTKGTGFGRPFGCFLPGKWCTETVS
jgi:hypothetical protein